MAPSGPDSPLKSAAQRSAPITVYTVVFLVTALCGRTSEALLCTKFAQEIIAKNDSLLIRADKPPTNYLELELRDCYLESSLDELNLNASMAVDYVNLKMINVTLAAKLNWKRVIPFTVNGTLRLHRCRFEDEDILTSLDITTINELAVIESGLRRFPHFFVGRNCALRKVNLSRNAIEDVPEKAFNSLFLNCNVLSDFDVAHNSLKRFPRVDPSQKFGKCRLYLESNPLSCTENDHLVMEQRTREMLIHTPHCDVNGSLVQFWFHNVKLCSVCNCSIHFDVDVDCSRRNLRELPSELPRETTHLNVSGNAITSLRTPDGAESYKKLKYLDASWNFIDRVDDYSPHICSLVLLDLSHNRLQNLPEPLVQELIDILNCRPLLTIGKIMLSHNPWACDCDLLHFKRFTGVKAQDIDDFSMVQCQAKGDPVWAVREDQLCPPPLYVLNPWDVAICVMLVLITGIISKTLADYYRQKQTGELPQFFKLPFLRSTRPGFQRTE